MDDVKGTLGLDDDSPWPGPAAYDEASQRFFHGRAQESAELLRLIQLSPFVALYGKSGLGKSSMLQAGLFPLLRAARFLPVYLRLDYTEKARLPPLAQAALRMREAIDAAGADAAPPDDGESLWAYLQRRKRPIWTADNYPLTPVMVFDQFEEVFSRGGSPEHVKAVLDSLADLAGDRLSTELAEDRDSARRLNLQSQQYRVVLSFRADFLADVESWEKQAKLPKRESLRLEALSRERAIEAVERAGAAVLEPGVATLVVDFLLKRDSTAGPGSVAEVEPVLLSLCCYQLNRRRKRPARINQALLDSVGDDILRDFYDEALEGLDPRVSVFIEDNLIQLGRYRSTYPRADALASGALTAEDLDLLTRRRLLRVDPQGDVPRIELIHDRLVTVVREARDARLASEREQQQHEEAELQAREREQQQREEAEQRARDERQRERTEQAERERASIVRWSYGLGALVLLLMLATGFLIYFARHAGEQAERANVQTTLAQAAATLASEQTKHAQAETEFAEYETARANSAAGEASKQAGKAEAQRIEAVRQRELAQQAEALALASNRRAEALRLVVEAQAMLVGAMGGDDRRAFQQLLAARQLQPGPEVEGSLLDALAARQHLGRFAPVVVTDRSDALALAFSPDGRLLATGHRDGSVALRALTEPHKELARASGHQDLVQMVSFSADGRLLLSASNDGTLRQWRVVDNGLAPQGAPLHGHDGPAYAAAYQRDASLIVSGGEDGTVRLWNAGSGQPSIEPVAMNTGPVWGVVFSPDGKSIAVATGARSGSGVAGSKVSNLILLDAATLREKVSLYAHADTTMSLAYSGDGRFVVTGGQDDTLRVRNLSGDQTQSVRIGGHKGNVQSVAFSPDGHMIASGSEDNTVRLWLAGSGEPLGLPLKAHGGAVTSVAFSPDGRWLASGGEDDRSVRLWPLDPSWATPNGQLASRPARPDSTRPRNAGSRPPGAAPSVALSADGRLTVFGRSDGSLLLRDEQAGTELELSDPRDAAGPALAPCAAASAAMPERSTAATRGGSRGLAAGPAAANLRAATSVAFSADGRSIVSGHRDGSLRRWDANAGQPVEKPILASTCAVSSLAWSADGRRLAAASDGQALLLDAASAALLQKLPLGHKGVVTALALSGDASWLASADSDATLRVRATYEGAAVGAQTRFDGLLDVVHSLAFSPDGQYLVSGNDGGNVRVWDRRSGRSLGRPIEAYRRDEVAALAFMPNGQRFLSSNDSGAVRPWPAPQAWPDLMCAKLGFNLSRKVWKEWVSRDFAYRCQCPGLPIEADDPGPKRSPEMCPPAR